MKLICGNSNRPLAEAIAAHMKVPLAECNVRRFADEEVFVEIHENVRGDDVYVIQSTSYPANDNLMELLVLIDALRRASAGRITCRPGMARSEASCSTGWWVGPSSPTPTES